MARVPYGSVEKNLVAYVAAHPGATSPVILAFTGIPKGSCYAMLGVLANRGRLSRLGTRRNYRYFVVPAVPAPKARKKKKVCRTCWQPRPVGDFRTAKTPWRCIECCRQKKNAGRAQPLTVKRTCKSCKRDFFASPVTCYCSRNCRSHSRRSRPIKQWRPYNKNVPDRIAAFVAANPGTKLRDIVNGSGVRESTCKFEVNQMFNREELRREGTPGRFNSVGYSYWIKYPRECLHG